VLLVAAVLRFVALDLKPPHHDEGVNGFFMAKLFNSGEYRYDPQNYHGPTLYYLSLPFAKVFGLDDAPLRMEPALFGVLTVGLLLALWPVLGRAGALAAAALMAVSAGGVFVSRYFIHESMVLFFTLGIVAALVWLPRLGLWVSGLLASASAAMLFCTKETANFTAAVLLIAEYLSHFYREKMGRPESRPELQPSRVNTAFAVAAVAVFAAIFVAFYSSLFTHWAGVKDGIIAPNMWRSTGTHGQGHAQPMGSYLLWLLREEPAILLWGFAGIYLAARRAESRFTVFAGLWAMGMLTAYSVIPYKTPWLTLNIVLPFCVCAGYAFEQVRGRGWALPLAATSLLLGLGICINLNFFRYDDPDAHPYVYVHTTREYKGLVAALKRNGAETSVDVVSQDYWPLPWTMRDYPKVIFHGKMGGDGKADFILAKPEQAAEIQKRYGPKYREAGTWELRPGVPLLLYERVHPP